MGPITVILGNQYNITVADLAHLESLLTELVDSLRHPQSEVIIKKDRQTEQHVVVVTDAQREIQLSSAQIAQLSVLECSTSWRRSEEVYLARFILAETYARWEREYVPLSGTLTPALRLRDRSDHSISSAGIPLDDVRQASTEWGKTRIVLLGEPGAGKTTTLHRMALDLARQRLSDPLGGKIPLRADLFQFSDAYEFPFDFLKRKWEMTGLSATFEDALSQGQLCILLDGINQMPGTHRVNRIERWAHWANFELPPGNWAVFTCRTSDYVIDLRLPEVHIGKLDTDRIRHYLFIRFGSERASELWNQLNQHMSVRNQRFERLARNPFMLSLLVERAAEDRAFGDNRAILMQDLAAGRLEHELREGRHSDRISANPRATFDVVMKVLQHIAFVMQSRGEGTSLSRTAINAILKTQEHHGHLILDEVLKLVTDAGLLEITEYHEDDGEIFSFRHHLLQEYFAAEALLYRYRKGEKLWKLWRVPWRVWQYLPKKLGRNERLPPPPVSGWEESVIMAVVLAQAECLSLIETVGRHNLPLAGRCLAEVGTHRTGLTELAETLRNDLLARSRSRLVHLRSRIAAGLALGELGHPELRPQEFFFEERTVWAVVPPMEIVPAGAFLLGSAPRSNERRLRRPPPSTSPLTEFTYQDDVYLPTFRIGRYPVTNEEYRYFIEDGGYEDQRWWSASGWRWREGGPDAHAGSVQDWMSYRAYYASTDLINHAREYHWDSQRLGYWKRIVNLSDEEALEEARSFFIRPFDHPAFWDDSALSQPARPVVGVNWYEAEAYCRWLSAVSGQSYRLPSELEWEKSGRCVDRRVYPWGTRFDRKRCNTVESQIHVTTPVGLFERGVSPYGLFDVCGNVWEWTADWYEPYTGGVIPDDDFGEKYRVMRGGSWLNLRYYARCAFRHKNPPDDFQDCVGFRVCSTYETV